MKLGVATFGGIADAGSGVLFDFTTGSLPGAITFTRASIGTYFNNAGTLITASNNVARFNYVSGVANLLIEPSTTNLVTQSNNFGDSSTWFGGGATLTTTAAQFISPDGTNDGWSVNLSVVAGYMYDGAVGFSNVPYTLSLWVKQITAGISLQLIIAGIASGNIVIATTLARMSFTTTPAAGGASYLIQVPNMAGSIGAYGAQLEANSQTTSYIPTTTTTVTRAADSATFTIPAGASQLVYTFDDNSTQTVAVSPGSYTIPTNLNRPNIKRIAVTVSQRGFAM